MKTSALLIDDDPITAILNKRILQRVNKDLEVIIKNDFPFSDGLLNKVFNMLAEIDSDSNDRKEQGSKEKCAQVLTYDIQIESQQAAFFFSAVKLIF